MEKEHTPLTLLLSSFLLFKLPSKYFFLSCSPFFSLCWHHICSVQNGIGQYFPQFPAKKEKGNTHGLPLWDFLADGDLLFFLSDLLHQQHLLLGRDQQRIRVHPDIKNNNITINLTNLTCF
jgi:hypothetical protein